MRNGTGSAGASSFPRRPFFDAKNRVHFLDQMHQRLTIKT